MAAAEEESKWRQTDAEDQTSTPRPPKKRFVASSSSSPSRSVDEENDSSNEDAVDPLMEPFEGFRRDAIFRQWKEYMRFGKRYKRRKIVSEKRQQTSKSSLDVWEAQFQQLRKALNDLVSEEHAESLKAAMHQRDENSRYQSILDSIAEDAPAMTSAIKQKSFDCKVTRSAQSFKSKREKFADRITPLLDSSLQVEYKDALSKWQSGEQSFAAAKDNLELHTIKYLVLAEELQSLTRKLEVAENTARDTRLELVNAENQLSMKKAPVQRPNAADEPPPPKETPSTEVNKASEQEDSLVQVQRTLDRQMNEIEAIKEQRIELKQQIAQAEMDLIELPELRIYKSPLIRQLYQAREYQRDQSNHLLSVCQKLRKDRDRLRSERRSFIQECDTEQLDHIKSLQKQLRKLDRELNQVRGQRDALQVIVEEYKSARDSTRASLPELQLVADARKGRTSILEAELVQLGRKCAALTGNRPFYEMAMAMEDKPITIDQAQKELSSLENTIHELRAQLAGQEDAQLDKEIQTVLEIKSLERQVREFQQKYGLDVAMTDPEQVLNILESTLASTEAKISEAQKTLKSLESGEVESASVVAEAFQGSTMLDEQNMAQIKELMDIEDEISKLRAERSKYSQTFTNLNKAKDSNGMVANALTKQIEKELAYIKQLNEREKNLNSQLSALERELTAGNAALECYQSKGDELDEALKDLKEKTSLTQDKVAELVKSVMDKIRLIEQGAHERLRLEESCELLRRKLDAATKVEKPAEIELRKQKEEYRSLLNCGSCGTRLKSHVLMRCMHTFCKDCLDIRIETRQRRCPTCGESFGINDVKQFYF
ncbi:hypothetical protein BJV82DRAFT_664357 [Fennellomyces sp. T-0311]|nr:hypothetical protein BJV82DRAFT_664357 [Fennellomyces sp. T-0311]